jgi:hypothetical protein
VVGGPITSERAFLIFLTNLNVYVKNTLAKNTLVDEQNNLIFRVATIKKDDVK